MSFKVKVSKKLISAVVKGMGEAFGEESVVSLGADGAAEVKNFISTQSMAFDKVLTAGEPGAPIVPFGRLVSCEGLNQAGKTTSILQVAKEAQRVGAIPIIFDNEYKLDKSLASKMGVSVDHILYTSGTSIEDTSNKIRALIDIILEEDAEKFIIIFWDSLGATPAEAELVEKGGMSVAARIIGQEFRKLIQTLSNTQTCLWVNNHIYRNHQVKFGDPWVPYGGEKPLLQATWRVRLVRVGMIKEGGLIVGSKIKIKNLKNNTAMPYQEAIGHILHGYGWSDSYTTFDLCKRKKIPMVDGGGKAACEWVTEGGDTLEWKGWKQFQEKVILHEEFSQLLVLAKEALPLNETKPKSKSKQEYETEDNEDE